jgi:hypothetical protein
MGMGLVSSLAGCANVYQGLKSVFATPYPVEITGAAPPAKTALFLKFSRETREGSISATNEEIGKQRLSAMFQRAGYQLKADEASASVIASVKLQAFGPDSESRSSQESRLKSCGSNGKDCTYEQVTVQSSYAVCRYVLYVSINESPQNIAQMKQGLLIRTEWQTEQLEGKSDSRSSSNNLAVDLTVDFFRILLLAPRSKQCVDEDKDLPRHLTIVERLLSRVDLPQGKQMVKEVDGELQFSSGRGF